MNLFSNQKGQIVVEYILLMAILVAIFTFVKTQFQQQQILAKFVSTPWDTLSGVIENGVMGSPVKTKNMHPNMLYRHASMEGDKP
jgi:hypothetical protein